jgi:hypothetical protein
MGSVNQAFISDPEVGYPKRKQAYGFYGKSGDSSMIPVGKDNPIPEKLFPGSGYSDGTAKKPAKVIKSTGGFER